MTNAVQTCYEKAQTIVNGALSTQLVRNDCVFPHWIKNSHCFWYQKDRPEGREFRLVDAGAASNELAFDHVALAEALAQVCGQSIDSNNLPISRVEIILSPLHIQFMAFDKRWLFDAEKGSCAEIEMPQTVEGLLSPDGKKTAFVRDDNLWIRDLHSGDERAVACPAAGR